MKTKELKTKLSVFAGSALLVTAALFGSIPAEASGNVIGKDKAEAIALEDAGYSAKDVESLKIKLEGKKNKKEYEVRFVNGDFRYEYELRASDGSIKDRDIDRISLSSEDAKKDIGKSKAKAIALEKSGMSESDVEKFKVKAKKEHGFKLYKIEFEQGMYEYEYEVDAYIGKVLDEEIE